MNTLKKYLKLNIYWLTFLLVYLIILVLSNYFQLLKFNQITKINFIVMGITTFIFGILKGRTSEKKGYIEGLKLGSIISLTLFLLNLLFIRSFNLQILAYYLIIIVSTTIGSMLGINLEKKS